MGKSAKPRKRMFVHSEMVAAGVWANVNKPDMLDEIFLSLGYKEGGCEWEFGIELRLLQGNHAAMLVRIFSDSWRAFKEAPEIFAVLTKFAKPSSADDRETWPKLIEALDAAGWKKEKPEPRELPKPPVCHACGRP